MGDDLVINPAFDDGVMCSHFYYLFKKEITLCKFACLMTVS